MRVDHFQTSLQARTSWFQVVVSPLRSDNIFLIAVAFVSGAMLVWPVVRRGAGGAQVNTLQATMMINQDALVLDVRDAAEYQQEHILNARNIPMKELESRLKEIDKYKTRSVIVTCGTGNRSAAAVSLLKKNGFDNVVSLSGGTAAWKQAGLPMGK